MDKVYQLSRLQSEGFMVPHYDVVLGKNLNDDFLEGVIQDHKSRTDFALDGVVIEVNNADVRKQLENKKRTSKLNPAYARKFKLADVSNNAIAVVKTVHWQITKDARLRPRIEIEPIDLMGVTITYATCHNAKYVFEHNINTGTMVRLTRSGDVIPYILDVVQSSDSPSLPDLDPNEYDWDENNVDYVLIDEEHPMVQFRKLKFGIEALGTEYLGESSIEKLFNAGYTTLEHVIKMPKGTALKVTGSKTGEKGHESLKEKLNPVKENILAKASGTFGRGIGSRILEPLVEKYGTLHTGITLEEIMEFDGIQEKTAKKIHAGLKPFDDFKKSIQGFYTLNVTQKPKQGGSLSGVTFVFTGFRDKDSQSIIENKGGKVASGVSKNVQYVVAKDPDSGSSKLKKAADLGCKIISIEEMKGMI